jgi:hypothetical protein
MDIYASCEMVISAQVQALAGSYLVMVVVVVKDLAQGHFLGKKGRGHERVFLAPSVD